MNKLAVWLDKLPEDKAKCYNRTRMSIELFGQRLGYPHQNILDDFKRHGYVYDEAERKIILSPNPIATRLKARPTSPQ